MQIVILEYSDGKVIRVNLNEQQEADYHDDADAIHQLIGSDDFKDRLEQASENVNRIVQTNHFIVDKPIHRHHLQLYPSDLLQRHNARSHSPRILCTALRCVDCRDPSFET